MNSLISDILYSKLVCRFSLIFLNVEANDGQRNSQIKRHHPPPNDNSMVFFVLCFSKIQTLKCRSRLLKSKRSEQVQLVSHRLYVFDNSFTLPASMKPASFGEFLLESLRRISSEQPPRAALWMWTPTLTDLSLEYAQARSQWCRGVPHSMRRSFVVHEDDFVTKSPIHLFVEKINDFFSHLKRPYSSLPMIQAQNMTLTRGRSPNHPLLHPPGPSRAAQHSSLNKTVWSWSLWTPGPTAAVSACEQQLGVAIEMEDLEEVWRTSEAPAGPDFCWLLFTGISANALFVRCTCLAETLLVGPSWPAGTRGCSESATDLQTVWGSRFSFPELFIPCPRHSTIKRSRFFPVLLENDGLLNNVEPPSSEPFPGLSFPGEPGKLSPRILPLWHLHHDLDSSVDPTESKDHPNCIMIKGDSEFRLRRNNTYFVSKRRDEMEPLFADVR